MGEAPFDQDAPVSTKRELTLEEIGALWFIRLQNERIWVDKHAKQHTIATMDAGHRENVRSYLRRHATRIQWAVDIYQLGAMPRGSALDDFTDELIEDLALAEPLEFLYQTPLYRALVAADLPKE